MGDGSNQSLKLWYYGPKKNPDILIIDVPVSANTHITLKGDIYNAGMVEAISRPLQLPAGIRLKKVI